MVANFIVGTFKGIVQQKTLKIHEEKTDKDEILTKPAFLLFTQT